MVSVCIYLVLFFFSAILLDSYHKNNKIFVFIGLLIPIIFAAGRYYVGTDFFTYVFSFNNYTNTEWNTLIDNPLSQDILFFIICKMSYSIGGRVLTFGIIAALTIVITYKTLRKQYPDIALGTAMSVFLFSAFAFSLNVSREYIAVAIIFWGLQYIFDDEFFKFIMCVVVAVMFHKSAVIALVMWFIWDHKDHRAVVGKKRLIMIFIIFIFVISYRQVIIFMSTNIPLFYNYASFADAAIRGTTNRDFYLALFQLVIVFIISNSLKAKDVRVDFMITMMCIALLIGITGFTHPHVKRVAYYFEMPASLVLCGSMPLCVKEKQRGLMTGLIVLYVVVKFILVSYILGQGNLIPYTFDLVTDALSII